MPSSFSSASSLPVATATVTVFKSGHTQVFTSIVITLEYFLIVVQSLVLDSLTKHVLSVNIPGEYGSPLAPDIGIHSGSLFNGAKHDVVL